MVWLERSKGVVVVWMAATRRIRGMDAQPASTRSVNKEDDGGGQVGLGCTTTKKRHIRDILGRTKKICHASDTCMMIMMTKPDIIINVVGSYIYDKRIM